MVKINDIYEIVGNPPTNIGQMDRIAFYADQFVPYLQTNPEIFGQIYQQLSRILTESFQIQKHLGVHHYPTLQEYINDPTPPPGFFIDKHIEELLVAIVTANEQL